MRFSATKSIKIKVGPEIVHRYVTTPENDTAWISDLRKVQVMTPGPFEVGTQIRRDGSIAGKGLHYTLQVDDLEANRRVGMYSIAGPFPLRIEYELEPIPASTKLTIRLRANTRGFFGLKGPFISIYFKRCLKRNLARLKKILETAPTPV